MCYLNFIKGGRLNRERLINSIKTHEGKRNRAYRDSEGWLTIGYGHNLDDRPLTDDVVELILEHDVEDAIAETRRALPYFDSHDETRQEVIVEMVFNLGRTRFLGFVKMLAALERGDYKTAADEMLDSRWHRQVGIRAETLEERMRGGREFCVKRGGEEGAEM